MWSRWWKNDVHKFQDMKLSGKLLLIYVVLFGAASLTAISVLQFSFHIYDNKLYEKSLQELDFFAKQTGDILDDIEMFTYSLATDQDIQRQLVNLLEQKYPSSDYNYALYQVRQRLLNELVTQPNIKNVVYIDPYGTAITIGEATPEPGEAVADTMLKSFDGAKGGYVEYSPTEKYPYFIGGRAVRRHLDMSMEPLGYLYVTVDIESVIASEEYSLVSDHAALFVYTDRAVIYQSQADASAKLPEYSTGQGYRIVHEKGMQYFLCYLHDKRSGWMYANWFPYSEIFGQLQFLRRMTLVSFALIALVSVILMRWIARHVTHPIDQLCQVLGVVETGDFEKAAAMLPETAAKDETGRLIQEFGVMLQRITTLIEENYKKQLIVQESKYKMLQAQINPHFLYNTLNSLGWLIKAGRNKEAQKMTVDLGKLLRAGLAKKKYSTVAEDIALVESYIAIQQMRYKDNAAFHLEAKGRLERYYLPYIVLQPLVENCINYGVENSIDVCYVYVSVEEQERIIRMQVKDTGPGMPPERLEQLHAGTAVPRGNGIGLANIRERLCLMFGRNMYFDIDSSPGQGTVVTIEIPKQENCPEDDR